MDDEARAQSISPAEAGLRGLQRRQPFDATKSQERQPLLPRADTTARSLSRLRRRQRSASGKHGNATVTQAVLMVRTADLC